MPLLDHNIVQIIQAVLIPQPLQYTAGYSKDQRLGCLSVASVVSARCAFIYCRRLSLYATGCMLRLCRWELRPCMLRAKLNFKLNIVGMVHAAGLNMPPAVQQAFM